MSEAEKADKPAADKHEAKAEAPAPPEPKPASAKHEKVARALYEHANPDGPSFEQAPAVVRERFEGYAEVAVAAQK